MTDATDGTESYPPLPPSPPASPDITFPPSQRETPQYIRTSFSSGYIRSNSTSSVPTPITSSPSTPGLRRHSQSRGHRYTKSLNAQTPPPPLPLPKRSADAGYNNNKEDSDERAETVIWQWRLKHSEAMSPRLPAEKSIEIPILPDNPKLWTPAQLAQYLLTALRFRGSKSSEGVIVPKPVAQDIANFVVKCKLNGRVFLRLAEKDIEKLGVNKLWRAALLSSSAELRKSLLKGRIWGFDPEEDNTFDGVRSTHESGRRVPSTVLEREESTLPPTLAPSLPTYPSSWPKDSNDHQEGYMSRSASVLSFESDTSVRDAISPCATRSRALSTSSVASSGVGRVQEIIRNLERSLTVFDVEVDQPSEDPCWAGHEMTSESEDDQETDAAGNTTVIVREEAKELVHSTNEHVPLESTGARLTGSPVNSQSTSTDETALIETPPLLPSIDLPTIPQLAHSSIPLLRDPGEAKWATLNEEPTIEALLREEEEIQEERPRATSWGAEAWEMDFPGGTSRRIPESTVAHTRSKPSTDNVPGELIAVPRVIWDDLSRRLVETERRLRTLEKQDAKRKPGVESPSQNTTEDHDGPKASRLGGLSPLTLPPYLVVVGVGVCALVAQFLVGRVVERRSRF